MKRLAVIIVLLLAAPAAARVPEGNLLEGITPGPDGMIDVLTVFAHQDDESIYGGGALLVMKQDPRVRLHILCMTMGDLSSSKDALDITEEQMGRIRMKEVGTAAAVYGAELIQFHYHDQGLAAADQDKVVQEVQEVMDRVGAEVVITHDPTGITGHTDHQTTSRVATLAFSKSRAQKLYYVTLSPALFSFYAVVWPRGAGDKPVAPTVRVDIRPVRKLKKMAMYAHASQKHFTEVGIAMDIMGAVKYEYFALAMENG